MVECRRCASGECNHDPLSAQRVLYLTDVFLGGVCPLAVLLTEGAARVLQTLDAEIWGGLSAGLSGLSSP